MSKLQQVPADSVDCLDFTHILGICGYLFYMIINPFVSSWIAVVSYPDPSFHSSGWITSPLRLEKWSFCNLIGAKQRHTGLDTSA